MNAALLLTTMADIDVTASIQISGFFYVVDFGAEVQPRYHHVGKNAVCNCALGENCPAVQQVQIYLEEGGKRAPEPHPGFYPVPPRRCPICKAEVVADHNLGSPKRGIGWQCVDGGKRHYWQRQVAVLQAQFQRKYAALEN